MSPSISHENNTTNGFTNGHHNVKKQLDGFGTRAIHVGSDPSEETGAVIPAISLSTTYKQSGVGIHKGFEYSRSGNPNRNALESTLASIESGGGHGIAFSSGSATTATVLQSLGPNSHIVSVNDVYGGTFRYMTRVASENQGLETTFLDLENASDDTIISAIRGTQRSLIWIESPTNPTLRLIDISRIASIAHSHPSHPIVLVDNTFLSPFYSSPLLLGADVVMHSLTKYINGHSDVVMGAVILPPHHSALAEKLRFLQNASGAVPSAYDCWLAQRGAKTLHLRMKAHGVNALAVAKALEKSPHVEEAEKFLTSTRLFTLAESLGGVESLAEHPAQMTHGSIPAKEREILGIGENLVRLSVGVEEQEDLIRDVEQALAIAVGGL
ncbi:Cys/Met metabolism PLP-dependent enzyme-domain-containing protein [Infundibulicybe gibba]|nr:Cys/Met metabolism PLP-dependent enzyme-domain-containing protein [Infundibulicybe gibba]